MNTNKIDYHKYITLNPDQRDQENHASEVCALPFMMYLVIWLRATA